MGRANRVNTLLHAVQNSTRIRTVMKTIITAHRAILTRAIIALFVLLSIAAVNPVDTILEAASAEIEQRATIENGYVVMATIQLRNPSVLTQEQVDSLTHIQQFYSGRHSAFMQVAGYLRALQSKDNTRPVIP